MIPESVTLIANEQQEVSKGKLKCTSRHKEKHHGYDKNPQRLVRTEERLSLPVILYGIKETYRREKFSAAEIYQRRNGKETKIIEKI